MYSHCVVSNPPTVRRVGATQIPVNHNVQRQLWTIRPHTVVARKSVTVLANKVNATVVEKVDDLPLPAGDKGLPIVGQLFAPYFKHSFIMERFEKYGPIFGARRLGGYTIYISGLENLEEATVKHFDDLRGWDIGAFKRLLGEKAISTLGGDEHTFVRKALFPAFTANAVNGYMPSMVQRASNLLEDWASRDTFSFLEQAKAFAFGIVANSIVGMEFDEYSEADALKAFTKLTKGFGLPLNLPFSPYRKALKARKELGTIVKQAVAKGRAGQISDKKALPIMMNAEDENGNKLNDQYLEDTIFTLMLAGFDSSSTTASQTLLELARHPDVLEKMRKEQEEIVAEYGSEITSNTLKAMPYLEAVIKESMRLNPAVLFIIRSAARTINFKGYKIPKGSPVILCTGMTMKLQDERWLGDAEFNPDRHLTAEGKKPGAQVPFGIGAHSCLGYLVAMAELRLLFALIARDYDFELDNLYPEPANALTPAPKDGVPARFFKRSSASGSNTAQDKDASASLI